MDIYQLKTFITVAREGSITRASERLHLSQPAVSAHIKAIEDSLDLTLFERTARGMSLTTDGQRLLAKAEQTLGAHQEMMDEATRIKGRLSGKLRLGAGSNSNHSAVGKLLTVLSERAPDVEVALRHGTSAEVLEGIRGGRLDAGFYNEPSAAAADLTTIEVGRFKTFVVAAPGLAATPPDWNALADLPWVYPAASGCCGYTAEQLFKTHRFRPKRIISVDREDVTRTLVSGRLGLGLLHEETAKGARERGEVELLAECPSSVAVLFAHLASRAQDPLLIAASSALRAD